MMRAKTHMISEKEYINNLISPFYASLKVEKDYSKNDEMYTMIF